MSKLSYRCSFPGTVAGAVFFLSLATAGLTSGCGSGNPPADASGPPPVPVRLQNVQGGTVEESSEFVGALEASDVVDLKPQIEGRIVEIYVADGESVEPGTPLIQLRPDRNQAEVNSAIANANASRAALRTSEADLRAATAEQESAAADLELARSDFERADFLVQEGAQSEQQRDSARRDLDSAIANLQAAEDRVNAARARVSQERAASEQAQAQINVAQEDLQYNRIASPISGVVGDITVKVGDYVDVGESLTTIVQNDTLDLLVSIPATRASQLRAGLPVELSDPDQDTPLATGRISFVAPSVDTDAQVILAKATFSNNSNLRDGQFVRARVIWQSGPGLLVPTVSISRIGGQSFVYVAERDTVDGESVQVARQRPVQLGPIQEDSYQILDGIESGERIIVSNILKLRDGAPIQPESESESESESTPPGAE
ncbi:MAG TPA: efflux RND transporter periplasmic adaptor subunit [Elainellaceae cyanobacterium]